MYTAEETLGMICRICGSGSEDGVKENVKEKESVLRCVDDAESRFALGVRRRYACALRGPRGKGRGIQTGFLLFVLRCTHCSVLIPFGSFPLG